MPYGLDQVKMHVKIRLPTDFQIVACIWTSNFSMDGIINLQRILSSLWWEVKKPNLRIYTEEILKNYHKSFFFKFCYLFNESPKITGIFAYSWRFLVDV